MSAMIARNLLEPTLKLAAVFMLGSAALASSAAAQVTSFDGELDGWTAKSESEKGNSDQFFLEHQSSGGDPGGYAEIRSADEQATPIMFAPERYLGDWSWESEEPGLISFSLLRDASAGVILAGPSLEISGPAGSAFISLPGASLPGGGQWRSYVVPLTEEAGWFVQTPGTLPDILADVEELAISANISSGAETIGIDNFRLLIPGQEQGIDAPGITVSSADGVIPNGVGIVDFGSTPAGEMAPSQTITIVNSGELPLEVSGLEVSEPFQVIDGLDTPIAPGEFDELIIELSTNQTGDFNGTASFTTNVAGANPFGFNLTGVITAPPISPVVDVLMPFNYDTNGGASVVDAYIRNTGEETFTITVTGSPETVSVIDPSGEVFESKKAKNLKQAVLTIPAGSRAGFWSVRVEDPAGVTGVIDSDLNDRVLYAASPRTSGDEFGYYAILTPGQQSGECGGCTSYDIELINTGEDDLSLTLNEPAQLLGIDGVDVTLADTNLFLPVAGRVTTQLEVCVEQSEDALVIERYFAVEIASDSADRLAGGAFLFDSDPVITNLAPENGLTISGSGLVFSWRTGVPASGELVLRQIDPPGGEQVYTQEETGLTVNHTVAVPGLLFDTEYEWFVRSATDCGVRESAPRRFTRGPGVEFAGDDACRYTLPRDYDQRVTIPVSNNDPEQMREFVASIDNPYEEIAIDFLGFGSSIANPLELDPQQEGLLVLAIHLQDAVREEYRFVAEVRDLNADPPIVDTCEIIITVDFPDFAFDLRQVSLDADAQEALLEVENLGDQALTDISVIADADFANSVIFDPKLEHSYLQPGETRRFRAIAQADALAEGAPSAGNLFAVAGATTDTLPLAFSCPDGKSFICQTLDGVILRSETDGWYCTNKPNISLTLDVPSGFDPKNRDSVRKATIYTTFTPNSGFNHQPHDVQVSLNGTEILFLNDVIPNGRIRIPIPPELLIVPKTGIAKNVLNVNSDHSGGHYLTVTQFELEVCLEDYTYCSCATNAEEVIADALASPLLTEAPPGVDVTITSPIEDAVLGAGQNVTIEAEVNFAEAHPRAIFDNGDDPLELLPISEGLFRASWRPQNAGDPVTILVEEENCIASGSESIEVVVTEPVPELEQVNFRTVQGQRLDVYDPGQTLRITSNVRNPAPNRSYDIQTEIEISGPGGFFQELVTSTQTVEALDLLETENTDLLIPEDAEPGTYRVTVSVFDPQRPDPCFDCPPDFWQFEVFLDGGAPVDESIAINNDQPFTNSREVSLSLSATDDVGVTEMRFRNENGAYSDWQPFSANAGWTLSDEDGSRTVSVQFRDEAGNISAAASDAIFLDRTAPSGTIVVAAGAELVETSEVIAELTFNDPFPASGVTEMRIGAGDPPAASFIEAAATANITLPDGDLQVCVQFRDAAGNVSESICQPLLVDTLPPNPQIVINNGDAVTATLDVSLDISAPDAAFGMVEIALANEDEPFGEFTPIEEAASPLPWTLAPGEDGLRTVRLAARDGLGNQAETSDSIDVDTSAPQITLFEINSGDPFVRGTEVTLSIEAQDPNGIATIYLANEDDPFPADGVPYQTEFDNWQLDDSDEIVTKTVRLEVEDTLGNRSETVTAQITPTFDKMLIVAGDIPNNNISRQTRELADFVYRSALATGWENIRYVSGVENQTDNPLLDNDVAGSLDGDGKATLATVEDSIRVWTRNAHTLVLFLIDHGQQNPAGFFVNAAEGPLLAESLDDWLDELQSEGGGLETAIVHVEASFSGGFIEPLLPDEEIELGRERAIFTSTTPDVTSFFSTNGAITYTHLALSRAIWTGANWEEAHRNAQTNFEEIDVARNSAGQRQRPLMEDNGEIVISPFGTWTDGADGDVASRYRFAQQAPDEFLFRKGVSPTELPRFASISASPELLPEPADVTVTATAEPDQDINSVDVYVLWTRTEVFGVTDPIRENFTVALEQNPQNPDEWVGTIPASAFQDEGELSRPGTYNLIFGGDILFPELLGAELGVAAEPLRTSIVVEDALLEKDAFEDDNTASETENLLTPGADQFHTIHRVDDVDWMYVDALQTALIRLPDTVVPDGVALRVRVFEDGPSSAPTVEQLITNDNDLGTEIVIPGLSGRVYIAFDACSTEPGGSCPPERLNAEMSYRVIQLGPDTDRDGLADVEENLIGTLINDKDSDDDTFEDGLEVAIGTDPLDPTDPSDTTDADNDGVPDAFDPDPATNDSDGDGYADFWEIANNTNANDPGDKPTLGDVNGDGDTEFTDAVVIFNVFLGVFPADDFEPAEEFDINRDGRVDVVDAVLLFNFQLGNIPVIPF